MSNTEKYNKIFMESFSVNEDQLTDELQYNTISAWDSIGHMGMIAALEDEFKIVMDTDDIIDFSSYKKGFEILEKYKVEF